MRYLGIIAALAVGLAGGSVALAQHGNHHGGGGIGSGDKKMSCCSSTSDMCDPTTCPGHIEMKDGACDMSKCCGEMMGSGMGDMMKEHHDGGMGDMGDMMKDHHGSGESTGGMMCGEKMKCCTKKETKKPGATRSAATRPSLK